MLARAGRYKVQKFAAALAANDAGTFYQNKISRWLVPSEAVPAAEDCPLPFATPQQLPVGWSAVEAMAYFDALNYMPEDVLTKVDRASMAVSLESRVPLLDYRVMELSASLPMSWKIRNGQGKWLLRQVLRKYVPNRSVDRPKMGFRLPLANWLRGPLRSWADGLLQPDELEKEGFLVCEPILAKWREHLDQRNDWSRHLWSVIMFQAWRRHWT